MWTTSWLQPQRKVHVHLVLLFNSRQMWMSCCAQLNTNADVVLLSTQRPMLMSCCLQLKTKVASGCFHMQRTVHLGSLSPQDKCNVGLVLLSTLDKSERWRRGALKCWHMLLSSYFRFTTSLLMSDCFHHKAHVDDFQVRHCQERCVFISCCWQLKTNVDVVLRSTQKC